MIRFIIQFIFILFLSSTLSANPLNGWFQDITPESNLKFDEKNITFTKFGDPPEKQQVEYSLKEENGLYFITLDYPGHWFIEDIPPGIQKWLILFNKGIMYIFTGDNRNPVNNGILGRYIYNIGISEYEYRTDSYLKEGRVEYLPQNLGITASNQPWVEGVNCQGIGQKIYITQKNYNDAEIISLVISNGFVSFERPYLYTYNSRLKKIKISNRKKSFERIYEIQDTPNIQIIGLPEKTHDVVIEILEVYSGKRWNDTCVNFIIPFESF